MLTITQIFKDPSRKNTFVQDDDYSFINPTHITYIRSCQRDVVMWDEDEAEWSPRLVWTYSFSLVSGETIDGIVENRENFRKRITGDDY
jgi:hypothetical protein